MKNTVGGDHKTETAAAKCLGAALMIRLIRLVCLLWDYERDPLSL